MRSAKLGIYAVGWCSLVLAAAIHSLLEDKIGSLRAIVATLPFLIVIAVSWRIALGRL